MLSVLIVDDHPVVRQGLKQILAEEFTDAEFGEAGDSVEALAQSINRAWDVIILDINIPGKNGLEVLRDSAEAARDAGAGAHHLSGRAVCHALPASRSLRLHDQRPGPLGVGAGF